MEQSFVVDSIGKSGRLAMLWKTEVNAQLLSYSNSHISLTIFPGSSGQPWRLSGFYGNPATDKRKASWSLLKMLKPEPPMAWLCMRDFNEILSNDEKYGVVTRSFSQMECFRLAIDECDLSDLGYTGSKYTWSNNREGRDFTKERLDRAMGNGEWPLQFSNSEVSVLPALNSGHSPLLITCDNEEARVNRRKRLFRYEAYWSTEQECKELIKNSWRVSCRGAQSTRNFLAGLDRCKQLLRTWSKDMNGKQKHLIRQRSEMIQELQRINQGDFNDTIKGYQREVNQLLAEEEIKWRQ
ncbi:hypothetical protein F2P56_014683, partial [Juglans regia]